MNDNNSLEIETIYWHDIPTQTQKKHRWRKHQKEHLLKNSQGKEKLSGHSDLCHLGITELP